MTLAVKHNGKFYYLFPVPESEEKTVKEKVRYQQVDIYINNCKELSGEIVEGRIYDITSGKMLTPECEK